MEKSENGKGPEHRNSSSMLNNGRENLIEKITHARKMWGNQHAGVWGGAFHTQGWTRQQVVSRGVGFSYSWAASVPWAGVGHGGRYAFVWESEHRIGACWSLRVWVEGSAHECGETPFLEFHWLQLPCWPLNSTSVEDMSPPASEGLWPSLQGLSERPY